MGAGKSAIAAIAWAISAAALFTVVYASAKLIGAQAHPVQIVFMRYFGACVVILTCVMILNGGFAGLISPRPSLHVMRAVSGVLSEFCIIAAPLYIAYEDATAIFLSNGVVAILLAIVLLKERASAMHWFSAMICLGGAMLVARAQTSSGISGAPLLGLGLAASAAVLSGAEMFFIKLLSGRERPLAIMVYVNVLAVLMLCVPAILLWRWVDGFGLIWLLAVGPVALLGQFGWIRAFQLGDAVLVVPFVYASIPLAAALGAVLFNQQLGLLEVSGGALVVVGGVMLARLGSDRPARA